MNLLNLISGAGESVRCSALLGVVDWPLMGLWVRFILYLGVLVGLMVLLYFEIRIIRQWKREDEERYGKPNQADGKFFESAGGNLSALGKRGLQLGNMLLHPNRIALDFDRRPKCVNALLNLCGIKHRCGEPPNAQAEPQPGNGYCARKKCE